MLLMTVTELAYCGCATPLLQAFEAFRRLHLQGEHPAVQVLLAGDAQGAADILRGQLECYKDEPHAVGERAAHAVVIDGGVEVAATHEVTLRIAPIPGGDGACTIVVAVKVGVEDFYAFRERLIRAIPPRTVIRYRDLYGGDGLTTLYGMLKYSGQ